MALTDTAHLIIEKGKIIGQPIIFIYENPLRLYSLRF